MLSDPLARAIAAAEELINAAPHIENEADLLEGLQYLAGGIASCTHVAFNQHPDHPFLLSGTGPFTKMGLDNPDTLYFGTKMEGGREYVVTGSRGTTTDLSFQYLAGQYTADTVPESEVAFDDRELDIAADGTFEWRFTPNRSGQLVIREAYNDWSQRRGTLAVHRTDTVGTAPPPPSREDVQRQFQSAADELVNRVQTWLQFPKWFYLNLPVNTLVAPRSTPGGLTTQYSSAGHYDLRKDQALIISLPVNDAPYHGFQLGSLWYISLDYINHQTSLNGAQTQVDPDGTIRIVVAEQNPGITNWVETLGHTRGYLQFRWQRLAREMTAADGPSVEVVDFAAVPDALPFYESNKISSDDWRARIALRQSHIGQRMLG
ncbi:hypothetical protein [Mycolicibacterium sp. 050158]|uniref:hypothetical protein n=1 Tax=Mycolicibacterium sp. 050158 TaxID=3090602 RepID=UPI00299CE2E2|nr:hypothetical protein [Mycolicibacterium sp. 050158]MDX1893140.1 hypothetical protein [Mycolicibacterium sp. 050158]